MIVREFCKKDERQIKKIYKMAFSGFPWFRELSTNEVEKTWKEQSSKNGFTCLVAEVEDIVVGAIWYDTLTIEQLRVERGEELTDFAVKIGDHKVIWLRETCVNPTHYKKGIARMLKEKALEKIKQENKTCLLLTRMRDDNLGIVNINKLLGLKRTGIKVPSTHHVGIIHEYWYLIINGN